VKGNIHDSLEGYYLNYFPYQLPLVLFLAVFSLLSGGQDIVFQFVNVAANMLSIGALAECGVLMFENRRMR